MRSSLIIGSWKASKYENSMPDHQQPVEKGGWFTAKVPGAIQYDLVAQGKLENPYASTKSAFAAAWVAKSDWLYQAEFDTPAIASGSKIFLRVEGIDTFSEVWLNGNFIGDTANAYRIYELAIKPEFLVTGGKNTLLIRIKAHERMIADKMDYAERLGIGPEDRNAEGRLGKALIRRYQRSFFSGSSSLLNIGTGVLGIGIIRNISLIWYPGAYLQDCAFRTLSISGDKAEGLILLHLENASPGTKLKIRIDDSEGQNVFNTEIAGVTDKPGMSCGKEAPVSISNPKLWWPRAYGDPYLYTLKVEVEDQGEIVDEITRRIGIRSSELVTKDNQGRKTFYLKINGRKILAHGTNLIPLDYIKSYGTREEYDRIFALMDNQNINLLRIWGGGMIEEPFFYEACNERGIMIFHDFFLHSMTYPDWDEAFVKEFMTESEGILKQLRTHPCLCLLCGGNEQEEGWDEWGWKAAMDRLYGGKFINELLPALSEKLCPELPYITNSPHGGKWVNSPVEGETHNWGNFFNSFKDPTFVTETCWTTHSYSRPETLKKYMDLDVDEFKGLLWPNKWAERTSLPWMRFLPYSCLFEVMSLREYLHSLEVEQMRADYHALSNFRFNSPSNNGVAYWSLNKGGPLFQFGCIDYGGYPMMPYYAVKRVFAPLAVQALRDMSDITVTASNHAAEGAAFTVEAFHLNKTGNVLGNWKWEAKLESGETKRIARLEGLYDKVLDRTGELVYVCILKDGILAADDMFFFCAYMEFEGIYKAFDINSVKLSADKWRLTIGAENPVRLVELESNHKLLFTDNYFPIIPGKTKSIDASLLERVNSEPVILKAGILGSGEVQTLILE